jgi:hypothetical protein
VWCAGRDRFPPTELHLPALSLHLRCSALSLHCTPPTRRGGQAQPKQHPRHRTSSPSSMSSCQATEAVRAQARVSGGAPKVRASDAVAPSGHGEAVQSGGTGQRPRHRGAAYLLRRLRLVDAVAVKEEADRVGGDALPVAEGVHELLQRGGLFALEVDLVAVLRDHLQVDVLASLLLLLVPHSNTGYCAEGSSSSVPAATRGRQGVRPYDARLSGRRVAQRCVRGPPAGELACTRALGGRDAGYGMVAFFFGGIKKGRTLSPRQNAQPEWLRG